MILFSIDIDCFCRAKLLQTNVVLNGTSGVERNFKRISTLDASSSPKLVRHLIHCRPNRPILIEISIDYKMQNEIIRIVHLHSLVQL
jgi:hypothetical protein